MRNKKLFCGNKSTKVLLHTTDGWIEGGRDREREGGDLIDCEEEMVQLLTLCGVLVSDVAVVVSDVEFVVTDVAVVVIDFVVVASDAEVVVTDITVVVTDDSF